jgi:hypothetical protein
MSRPSDHHRETVGDFVDSKNHVAKTRFGKVMTPSFKGDGESLPAVKFPHSKRLFNSHDRKNILLGLLALVVFLVVLGVLEIKQIHEESLPNGKSGGALLLSK